ncbi:DUF222 domain-containing protein, partial [Saccharopolyspora sp. NPDC000359]|uniref:HNH endonuclease signature motif containing protein n=1 Tax=Saccharopolyspora sp. NPDC000359 TaxID=3154251 RepID=UPI00332CA757
GVKDPRTVGQRNADGLTTLLDLALDHDGMPRVGGQRPHLTVTINYTDLQQQVHTAQGGAGMLEYTGQYLSPQAIRRIACDCEILPIVVGGDSLPLDVGTSQRTAPAHLRAALLARDGTCAFPGCDQPPGTPQAHHIRHWIDGGPTALNNMVMLCAHHHRTIHHHHWHITLHQGKPIFTPPHRINPTRTPQPGTTAQPTTHHHALTQLTPPPRPPGDTTPHHPTP